MLKKLLMLSLLFLCCNQTVWAQTEKGTAITRKYDIVRNDYSFSTVFELSEEECLVTSVVKSVFNVRTHYALHDPCGVYKGQGICRFFCLGLFYTWGTEIDVYDEEGNKVGLIDGQAASSESAKFSLYNEEGEKVGIAYLDKNCSAFSIVHPQNSSHLIARLGRKFVEDTVDYWTVAIYDSQAIPERVLQVFAAFACDTQDKFKKDQ